MINNAQRRQKPRKYIQKVIKLIKSVEINSVFHQFNVVYNEIDVKLNKNLKQFLNTTLLNNYFQELNNPQKYLMKFNQKEKTKFAVNKKSKSRQKIFQTSVRGRPNSSKIALQ